MLVVLENHSDREIIGNTAAPYLNSLRAGGAYFSQSYAVTHPSQPNYLALFSGSTQGVTNDSCPHTFATDNQAHQLISAGLSFAGYSEALPGSDPATCGSGTYARKHSPWTNFRNLPASVNRPFTDFPTDYTTLPTVSWVIPDLCNDMHSCPVATGDGWLRAHLGRYATWAMRNNSLLVITFDEDDFTSTNRIATIVYGQKVKPGTYTQRITHYSVLRTIEDLYGLAPLGAAASATSITDAWK